MAGGDRDDIRQRLSGMFDQFAQLRDAQAQLAEMQAEGERRTG